MEAPVITRGSTTSYAGSPMAKLMEQYNGEEDGEALSTEAWVTILVTKDNLETELIEKVEDLNKGITKYKFSDEFVEVLSKVSTELQVFVEKAAGLIEERTRHFIVDPKDTLIRILKGTTSLPQLNVAWKTFQKRLELGHRTLNKYMLQYQQGPQTELLLSPVSTLPDLHSELNDLHTADQRLRYMYQKFPNHREHLTEQAETALDQGKSWMNILPLPTTWKTAFIPEKEQHPETSERRISKGKQREVKEGADDEEDNDLTARVWLGAETPFKGPNKWFGGGRLKARESVTDQVAMKSNKTNQNVLFGIATPQIPIWASDPSTHSKCPKVDRALQLRKWPDREAPPHIAQPARRESLANRKDRDNNGEDPPDDGGDDDDADGDSNADHGRHCRGRRASSSSTHFSRRGRRGGGSPPSEPSDNDESSSDSDSTYTRESTSRRGRKRRSDVIPYGRIKPTIKPEIKQDLLPRWDGSPNTAVDYFLKIQQLAALEGDLPEALGYWLWMNLEDGSDIKNWFATLTFPEQAHMRSHYINYLRGIKDGYLGEAWQSKINRVYEGQYFRQVGHEKELPKTFIIHRIMYTRMLTSAKPGGTLEISLIMRKAPLSWKTILVMPSIKSTKALYTKVVDYEDDLLEAWRRKSAASSAITAENLIPTLRRLGWEQPRSRMTSLPARTSQDKLPQDHRVLLTIAEEENQSAENSPEQEDQKIDEVHEDMLREVYQVMQQRQRAPPPGGYMFSRNDHVTTKMGKLPPSPCQACGSRNHWDKECPDWEVYRTRRASDRKSGHSTEKAEEEGDTLYQSAYSILLSQRLASSQIDLDRVKSDFNAAVHCDEVDTPSVEGSVIGRKSGERRGVTVQEVEDESWLEACSKPKALKHLLYHVNEEVEDERPLSTKHPTATETENSPSPAVEEITLSHSTTPETPERLSTFVGNDEPPIPVVNEYATAFVSENRDDFSSETKPTVDRESSQDWQLPPPPKEFKPVRISKKRFYPAGESSVGVSVLSVKGWVGNLDNSLTDLRLDSCADVTLISSEYYDSLKASPPIQQGMRMQLWQLTDKNSSLRGFVRIPIFMMTDDGTTIESEAEAYVVPGMTVPILLGEDYQLTYEVGVTRNVEDGPRIHFGKSGYEVPARQVERTRDFDRMRQSAYSVGRFIRNKLHR